jgi:murein DD-endopeptidase MepM/ murein hydrolase activator NlpD
LSSVLLLGSDETVLEVEPELATASDASSVAPEPEVVPVESALALDTPEPTEWMPALRRCTRRGGRHFCDGPRRVAIASADAQARAQTLDIGSNRTASTILTRAPEASWVAAVDGEAHGAIAFPVEVGRVSRGFGYVRRAAIRHIRHDGVDIAASVGSPVRAVDDGLVVYADNGVSGYGNLVLVVHADGSTSLYAHLRAAYLAAGERVRRGQTLGEVGNTGLSYAPHLHFEYRRAGRLVDPEPLFDSVPAHGPVNEAVAAHDHDHDHDHAG